jgi:hypothetical protein
VIDSSCDVNGVLEAAAATLSSIVTKCVASIVRFGTSSAEHLHVLLRLEVGCPVVAEDEGVGVGIMCMLAVVIGDDRVVQMVTALLPGERARVGHVLVELGAELQELGIIGEFTAISGLISEAAEGSGGHGTDQGDESES